MSDPLHELSELLTDASARVSVVPDRVAPSTLYDASYHMCLLACAFTMHAKRDGSGQYQLSAALLRLLQFVSARPGLLPDLLRWLRERGQRELDTFSKMPRGHVGDQVHGRVVEYFVSAGVLRAQDGVVAEGPRFAILQDLAKEVEEANLFESERQVLGELLGVKIYRTVLEGQ